jgi:hypothetical protein
MVPDAIRSATSSSCSAAESSGPGSPAVGQRSQTSERTLAYPESSPIQYGELVDSASSTGSAEVTRWVTATASSRSGTPTCTCAPQISCSRASSW